MEKPILHKIIDPYYLQFIKDTYPPSKTTAGEDYDSELTYITFEKSFLTSPTELELLNEKGFAPLGFLLTLRVEMSKALGYGISLDDKSLPKIFSNIHIDSDIPLEEIKAHYEALIEYGLLFIISDNDGHRVVTTPNQLYNWELKEYTKWYNKEKKRKSRKKEKSAQDEDNDKRTSEEDSSENKAAQVENNDKYTSKEDSPENLDESGAPTPEPPTEPPVDDEFAKAFGIANEENPFLW